MSKTSAMIRACRGPILLIALGALTAADTFGTYSLTRTWPILLILFGLMKLAEKGTESHDIDGPGSYPQGPAAYAGNPPYPGQTVYPGQPGYPGSGAVVTPVVEVVRPVPPETPKHD